MQTGRGASLRGLLCNWLPISCASLLLLGGSVVPGCTKVREQPPASPVLPAEAPAPAPKPTPRRPPPPAFGGSVAGEAAPASPPAPAAPAPPVAPADTLNGDPKGPKREELSRALDGALPGLARCFDGGGGAGSVGLAFDVEPSGRAAGIKVTGASPTAERCVREAVAAVRLPTFEGKPVPIQFPLTVHRSAGAAPAAGSSPAAAPSGSGAAAAAGSPPVFVQP